MSYDIHLIFIIFYTDIRRESIIFNSHNDAVSVLGGATLSVSTTKIINIKITINQDLDDKVEEIGFVEINNEMKILSQWKYFKMGDNIITFL